jgi:hypothetical protein
MQVAARPGGGIECALIRPGCLRAGGVQPSVASTSVMELRMQVKIGVSRSV